MKKILITILLIALVFASYAFTITQVDAFGEDVYNTEYTVNLVDKQIELSNKDSNYPIIQLNYSDVYFSYEIGYLREPYNEFDMGSTYFIIKELYIEIQGSKWSNIGGNIQPSSFNITAYYAIPSLDDGSCQLELYNSSNRIYTTLQYEDIINGVSNISEYDLASFTPTLSLYLYSSNYGDGINLHPSAKLQLGFQTINFRVKQDALDNEEFYLQNPNIETTPNRHINFDISFNSIDYPHIQTFYDNSIIREHIEKNDLVPNVNIDGYDNLMTSLFGGFADILNVEVFPNITIGLIIGLPLLLGALLIILKFIRG